MVTGSLHRKISGLSVSIMRNAMANQNGNIG